MCGVVGIVGKADVKYQIYDALTVLQHRGQDAAGIMTCRDGQLSQHHDKTARHTEQRSQKAVGSGEAGCTYHLR